MTLLPQYFHDGVRNYKYPAQLARCNPPPFVRFAAVMLEQTREATQRMASRGMGAMDVIGLVELRRRERVYEDALNMFWAYYG